MACYIDKSIAVHNLRVDAGSIGIALQAQIATLAECIGCIAPVRVSFTCVQHDAFACA